MLTNKQKKQFFNEFFRSRAWNYLDREKAMHALLGHNYKNFFETLDKLSLKNLEKLYFILTRESADEFYSSSWCK